MCVPTQGWKHVPSPESQCRYHCCVMRHAHAALLAGLVLQEVAVVGVGLGLELDEAANQQGDVSWIGSKTEILLWSSMLRPKCTRPRETVLGTRWSLQPDCQE